MEIAGSSQRVSPRAPPSDEVSGEGRDGSDSEAPLKLRNLVLDAGPIIKGVAASLYPLAEQFWTTPDVLQEIRDKKARRALDNLPFELKVRKPSEESFAAATRFARASGDLRSLSAADIGIIALARMLEEEEPDGGKTLRDMPALDATPSAKAEKKATGNQVQISRDPLCSESAPASKGGVEDGLSVAHSVSRQLSVPATSEHPPSPPWNRRVQFGEELHEDNDDDEEGQELGVDDEAEFPSLGGGEGTKDSKSSPQRNPAMSWAHTVAVSADQPLTSNVKESEISTIPASAAGGESGASDIPTMSRDSDLAEEPLTQVHSISGHSSGGSTSHILSMGMAIDGGNDGGAEEDEEDGAGEWIQPEKFGKLKAEGLESTFRIRPSTKGGEGVEEKKLSKRQLKRRRHKANAVKRCRTGCSSTDFTVQNVLLQMGITLVSGGGDLVRKARKWLLRCTACFRTCAPDASRLFCPVCGNSTLERIACSVDAATGEVKLHMRPDRKPTAKRGTKYSLPAPGNDGDRFSGGLLLREDQLLTGIWAQKTKSRASSRNVRSAFGEHITESVGLQIDKDAGIVVGKGHKNPNAAKGRERRGKKKSGGKR